MVIILGKIALWLALLCSFIQASDCGVPKRRMVGLGIALSLLTALGVLITAHVTNDFSVVNVFEHSHSLKPLLYKVTGVWGNHEGSMLLLITMMAIYHAFFSFLDSTPHKAIQLHALLLVAFLSFLLFTSSPFVSMGMHVTEGLGLNPLLQDIGLAIHPPLLYVGYTGLSMMFSMTVVALLQNSLTAEWVRSQLRLVVFVWSFLSAGIALGSWWSYRELGWGGYWFWDPVENVSLMPWILTTALLHSLVVVRKTGRFKSVAVLLGMASFILSLVGIFLVRSGVLTSVHAFAEDPARGLYVLGFVSLVLLGSIAVYGKYKDACRATHTLPRTSSLEIVLLLNNVFLVSFCFCVLLGTLYPLIMQVVAGEYITVAAPYFNQILSLFMIPFALLMIITPALGWQSHVTLKSLFAYMPTLLVALGCAWYLNMVYVTSILGWWLIWISLWQLKCHYQRWVALLPMVLAHAGVGLMTVSVTVLAHQTIEKQQMLHYDEFLTIGKYRLTLQDMMIYMKENYMLREGTLVVEKEGESLATLTPQVRYYPVRKQNTTEAAIFRTGLSDIYVVMGETNGQDAFGIRVYYRPMINGLWLSAGMLVVAGMMACLRKKKRQMI